MADPATRRTPAARQQEAMIKQFTGADTQHSHQLSWQRIRRAAAEGKLMRLAR